MPTTDLKGHTVPEATGEAPARAAFDRLSRSIMDPIPVADATARAAALSALAGATPSITPSSAHPIFFYQHDLPVAYRTIWTVDGVNFIAVSGEFVWANATERAAATGMVAGDRGYQVDTGVEYWYSGSAWLANLPGLNLIVPSSVAGTGVSVSDRGTVTLSSASSASINGVFSSRFQNYQIVFNLTTSTTAAIQFVLRASGSDATSAYDYQMHRAIASTSEAIQSLNQGNIPWQVHTSAGNHHGTVDLFGPAVAGATRGLVRVISTSNPMTPQSGTGQSGFQHRTANAYDGFKLTPSAGNLTGTVRVYGYNE